MRLDAGRAGWGIANYPWLVIKLPAELLASAAGEPALTELNLTRSPLKQPVEEQHVLSLRVQRNHAEQPAKVITAPAVQPAAVA